MGGEEFIVYPIETDGTKLEGIRDLQYRPMGKWEPLLVGVADQFPH